MRTAGGLLVPVGDKILGIFDFFYELQGLENGGKSGRKRKESRREAGM